MLKEIIIFDQNRHQINAAETDWLVIRGGVLRDIFYGISSKLGDRGKTAIEEIGAIVGKNFAVEQLQHGMQPNEIPTILSLLLNQGGWGKVTVEIDVKSSSGLVTIENCVLARNVNSNEANCHFLKGYFKGLMELLGKVEVECNEVTCMSKGDSFCQFKIKQV